VFAGKRIERVSCGREVVKEEEREQKKGRS
jgi:hypothetical protein